MLEGQNKFNQQTSSEMVRGGSYIPQSEANVPTVPKFDPSVLGGQASDVNDAFLSMNGVVNGDPIGLETFDLGFSEDGTPAITINGANIPVQHNQWMALLR